MMACISRGSVDAALMWLTDLFLSLPQLPLLLLLIYLFRDGLKAVFGPEGGIFILIVLVIGGLRWMPVARLVRAQFLSLREKDFVEAARALGAGKVVAVDMVPERLKLAVDRILPERSHVRVMAGADFLFGNGEGKGLGLRNAADDQDRRTRERGADQRTGRLTHAVDLTAHPLGDPEAGSVVASAASRERSDAGAPLYQRSSTRRPPRVWSRRPRAS